MSKRIFFCKMEASFIKYSSTERWSFSFLIRSLVQVQFLLLLPLRHLSYISSQFHKYIVEEYFCYQKIILLHFCKVSVTDVILVFGNRRDIGVWSSLLMALALGARYRELKSPYPDHLLYSSMAK